MRQYSHDTTAIELANCFSCQSDDTIACEGVNGHGNCVMCCKCNASIRSPNIDDAIKAWNALSRPVHGLEWDRGTLTFNKRKIGWLEFSQHPSDMCWSYRFMGELGGPYTMSEQSAKDALMASAKEWLQPVAGSTGDLDARMKAAGMRTIDEMLSPMAYQVHAGMADLGAFEYWLERKAREYAMMQVRRELGDDEKDDELYEWVLAHASTFKEVLVNFRAALPVPAQPVTEGETAFISRAFDPMTAHMFESDGDVIPEYAPESNRFKPGGMG